MIHHSMLGSPQHEPMVMGSPPSPSSTGNYLPGYLMGGDSSFHASPAYLQPSRNVVGVGPIAGSSPLVSRSLHSSFLQQQPPQQQQQQQQRVLGSPTVSPPSSAQRKRTPNLMGLDSRGRQAPPTNSLWSTPPAPASQSRLGPGVLQEATSTPKGLSAGESGSRIPTSGRPERVPPIRSLFRDHSLLMTQSPAQLDPFYTQGDSLRHDESLDERWVTIFGYPEKAANFVIEQFSHCGTIVKYVIVNEGNWAHVKFQTKLQARKALSKNGKLLAENFMIAVLPCIDKRVMAEEDVSAALDASLDAGGLSGCGPRSQTAPAPAPTPQHSVLAEQSFNCSMRSLTARGGGHSDTARRRVSDDEDSSVKDREGILSKAVGYLFGWT